MKHTSMRATRIEEHLAWVQRRKRHGWDPAQIIDQRSRNKHFRDIAFVTQRGADGTLTIMFPTNPATQIVWVCLAHGKRGGTGILGWIS